jgi:hypothetical protein
MDGATWTVVEHGRFQCRCNETACAMRRPSILPEVADLAYSVSPPITVGQPEPPPFWFCTTLPQLPAAQ